MSAAPTRDHASAAKRGAEPPAHRPTETPRIGPGNQTLKQHLRGAAGWAVFGGNGLADPGDGGNQHLQALWRAGVIRAKLAIGAPHDPAEAEADHAAEAAMRGATPCACGGTCATCSGGAKVRRKTAGETAPAGLHANVFRNGGGRPLDATTLGFFGPRFGADFSRVRVHDDTAAAASARAIGARAFMAGNDIGFAPGEYAPGTNAGRWLLAHELAHVALEGDARAPVVRRQPAPGVSPTPPAGPPTTTQPVGPQGTAAPGAAMPGATPQVDKFKPPPDPKGQLVVNGPTNVTFSDNPEYVRYQLEAYVTLNGTSRLGAFDGSDFHFGLGLGPLVDRTPYPTDDTQRDYLNRVIALVHTEVVALRARISTFLKDFERRSVDKLLEMLAASKARVEQERARYDVQGKGDEASVETGKETEDLTRRARDLAEKQQAVVAAKATLDSVQYGPGGESAPGGVPDEATEGKQASAQRAYDEAQRTYAIARNAAELRHPILVSYKLDPLAPNTPEALANLGATSSTTQAATLAQQINEKLDNIATVQDRVLTDWSKVWDLPNVLEAAKQWPDIHNYPGLGPGVRDTVIAEKRNEVALDQELVAMFSGIALFALAVVAALPTGGMSVGAATAVSAAGVAEEGLLAFTALQSVERYQFQSAAAGTDFDQAKAISQDEPSLFWVALDVVAALAGPAKGALEAAQGAFRRLVALRRAYLVAKAAGRGVEAEEELATLVKEGNEIGKGSELGTHLAEDTKSVAVAAEEHGGEIAEIERNLGRARREADGSITVPVDPEGKQFWKRTPDGRWCRYASPPLCYIGGSIESTAIDAQVESLEAAQGEAAAGAGSQVTLDDASINDLINNLWEVEKKNHPEQAAVYDRYIENLRKRRPVRDWQQSEKEMQFLYGSREQRVLTEEGLAKPDFSPATGWHGEIKNWNILYPTEEEVAAGARGALPKKLQGLKDQVARRRLVVGNRQTVVIDIRGQLSVKDIDPVKAVANQTTVNQFAQMVADAVGLPREQIQVLTW